VFQITRITVELAEHNTSFVQNQFNNIFWLKLMMAYFTEKYC
jgi:hypothetical protein